jgi:thiol-disulfide isomerase/thioredoxin
MRALRFDWIRWALPVLVTVAAGVFVFVGVRALIEGRHEAADLPDEGPLPRLSAADPKLWFNSLPLSSEALHGKVVLVDFWTYSCINSLRNLPYVKSWAEKYRQAGLVVIGVHSPEFSFEKDHANVALAVQDYHVTYPVVMDSDYRIWQSFDNSYWPADYIADRKGRLRHHHFGEGDYAQTEHVIQKLLREGGAGVDASVVQPTAAGVEAPPNFGAEGSPETYVGYGRGENFASPEHLSRDARKNYSVPATLRLNQWALAGAWYVGAESALLEAAPGKVAFRFHSRDLHMVLVPSVPARTVRYVVRLDGAAPNADHGSDAAPNGEGQVREARLYQLIRQKGEIKDRTFEIEFLDPGVKAYVFTFG